MIFSFNLQEKWQFSFLYTNHFWGFYLYFHYLILTIGFYLYSTIGQIRRSISFLFRQTYYHLSFFCIYPMLISTLSCEFSLQINTFPLAANQPHLSFSPRPLLHLHPLHGIFRLATLRFYLFSNSVLLTVFSVRDNVVIIAVWCVYRIYSNLSIVIAGKI